MAHIYINTRQAEEKRVVAVEDGTLTGFEQEIAGRENRKGDIYKAVVVRIESGLDAAFLDFGDEKNGFLPLKDVAPNLPGATGEEGALAEGDSILVQIKKDYSGGKGAGLTTFISLAGCYLVLTPVRGGKTHVSRRGDSQTRDKMRRIVAALPVPKNMSVIVRTAGLRQEAAALEWDLESYLLKLWRMIEEAARSETGPALIYRENNILMRAARDHFNPAEDVITCDDAESYEELRDFMSLVFPESLERLRFHEDEKPMISDALEAKIDEIFEREIQTPSGARIVFDSTEAMVTVDVNSARLKSAGNIEETALSANLEAAEAVARHLRLRDLAGLIVVDFIDMEDENNRKQVEQKLRECFKKDKAQLRHTAISQFGIVEISRQRLARSVEEGHNLSCVRCAGTGRVRRAESLAAILLRRARVTAVQPAVASLLLQAPPEVAVHLLNEKRVALRRLEDSADCEILVVPDERLHPHEWRLRVLREKGLETSGELMRNAKRSEMPLAVTDRTAPRKTAPVPVIKRVMPETRAPAASQPPPQPSPPPQSQSQSQPSAKEDEGEFSLSGFFKRVAAFFSAPDSPSDSDSQSAAQPSSASSSSSPHSRRRRGGGGGRSRSSSPEGRGARANGGGGQRRGNRDRDRGDYRDNRESRDNRENRESRDHRESRGNGGRRRRPESGGGNRPQADRPRRPFNKPKPDSDRPQAEAKETAAATTATTTKPEPVAVAETPKESPPPTVAAPPSPPKPSAKKPGGGMKMVETENSPASPPPPPKPREVVLENSPPPPKPPAQTQNEQMRQVETGREAREQ